MRPLPILLAALALAQPVAADPQRAAILGAFAANCFSPLLNAASAEANIASTGARVDFYDLTFAVVQRTSDSEITPGTDRRCDVSFDGDYGTDAAKVAVNALTAERILTDAPLPATHGGAALPGTTLLAARALNPNRVAVVHTGTRPGPRGVETFLSVERLTPDASREALK